MKNNESSPGQWPVLHLSEPEAGEVVALFHEVFKTPMSMSMWHWKYGGGRGVATGMRDSCGHLVAHYGGTLRVAQWCKEVFTVMQIGDVMVAPSARDVFARMGPFGKVSSVFIQHYLNNQSPRLMGFGFPNSRHARLGQRLNLYWPMCNVYELQWSDLTPLVDALKASSWCNDWCLREFDAQDDVSCHGLDELAKRAALLHGQMNHLWLRRDLNWWRHRYVNHPEIKYRIWLWYESQSSMCPVGAFVLKISSPGSVEVMDWILLESIQHEQVIPLIAGVLRGIGGDWVLKLWCSEVVKAALGSFVQDHAISQLACQSAVTVPSLWGHPVADFSDRFWLTGGDTDFR